MTGGLEKKLHLPETPLFDSLVTSFPQCTKHRSVRFIVFDTESLGQVQSEGNAEDSNYTSSYLVASGLHRTGELQCILRK